MAELGTRLEPMGEDIAAKVIDGEAIIINLTTGMYFSLDGVGAEMWEALTRGESLGHLVEGLVRRYQVEPERIRDDVTRLADEFVREGLMRPATTPPAAPPGSGPPNDPVRPYETPRLQKYSDMAELLALDPPMPGLARTPWVDSTGDR